ncbi:hypothetical protein [Halonotius roseus]|uniref:IPT/TIG domain-containing protein n=1 Tax=Halonotius roseus TaxID=2511997 RepID=A0A544QRT7_9EURY|nr:hypothetical protein [Halonotius roseus]TQQ82174.1 hypothetical protein EWF95_04340 [Halonotius roseus]
MSDGLSSDLEDTLQQHRRGSDTAGTLVVSDDETYVGDTLTFNGRNLPANERYELQWQTTDGRWGVLEANEVVGAQYHPRTETIATVRTDGNGAFDETWTVEQDYGGSHRVEVVETDGTTVASASVTILPHFELGNTTAQLGEFFTITGYGIGPNVVTNNYQVAWDNGNMGFMTGVMNRGTATARIRAVGPPGKHVLQVWRNYRGVPYLQNNTQSPYGPVAGGRQSQWTVEVTEPDAEPRTAWLDDRLDENPISIHYPDVDTDGSDAELSITPSSGQPGTTAFISGEQFPPNEEVDLIWYRHEGHRVKGIPITPEPIPDRLPTVTTDDEGTFQTEITIPASEGSTRPITAAVDGEEIAITGFMMQPSIETFSPTSGPVGTTIEIELSGVGWPIYENAPYFLYDNKPLGYVCGLSDDDGGGIVRLELPATGQPGWHFIDAYPCIFEMQEDEPDFELRPHLSYLDNHPVRPMPAYHMAFKIEE